MYIPNTIPSTLAEMLAFLTPTVEDGLFDTVAYDDQSSPTKIVCTQDGNTILDVVKASYWEFYPYVADGTRAATAHCAKTVGFSANHNLYSKWIRCKGGIVIFSRSVSGTSSSTDSYLAIGKGTNEKTAFFVYDGSGDGKLVSIKKYYSTCFGDNTALALYSSGWYAQCNCDSADRTILTPIPIVGTSGSTDTFSTVFIRSAVQVPENGTQQIIGGKTYGCNYHFAVLDE